MTGAARTPEDYQIEDFITDESFINYFFGLNAEDAGFWTKWLVAHPRNAALAEQAKEMLRTLTLTLPEAEFEAELSRIRTAIHEDAPLSARRRPAIFRLWERTKLGEPIGRHVEDLQRTGGRGIRNKRKRSLGYGSLLLILVLSSVVLWRQFNRSSGRLTEKTNDSGKPVVFTLSDGSVVTLAPQGILHYPADFGAGERKVILEGEAQFRVSRNEAHPIKVYEGDIVAIVLGTVFHVKEQAADSAIQVELISGKLRVETIARPGLPAQSILLDPDERVVYRPHSQRLYKEKWQFQHAPGLSVGHLVFRKNNFEEIALQMKTLFGVTVVNRSNKKNWRFTGDFVNVGPAEIVENICLVEGLHSETDGDTILIK
jgi:transmembrane sensor